MKWPNAKVAITGGFGGIGIEIVKTLLSCGCKNIAIMDLCCKPFETCHDKANIIYERIDVTDKCSVCTGIKNVNEKFKNIDVFINCSGIIAEDDPEKAINVNYRGVVYTTMAAMQCMGKQNKGKGGLIANVSSVLGLEPCNALPIYTGTKHGVIGFTRSLADECHHKKTGINFMLLCPGITTTDLIGKDLPTMFPYAQKLMEVFFSYQSQCAEECGKACVQAMSTNKNGSIWISDLGKLREVEPTVYWKPQKKC